jgi:hypothetical protein
VWATAELVLARALFKAARQARIENMRAEQQVKAREEKMKEAACQ